MLLQGKSLLTSLRGYHAYNYTLFSSTKALYTPGHYALGPTLTLPTHLLPALTTRCLLHQMLTRDVSHAWRLPRPCMQRCRIGIWGVYNVYKTSSIQQI